MAASDKFNSESKQKMKKMIELSLKEGVEYFTIIKKDYTLGKITKGEREYCDPEKIIKDNKEDVIGLFHTHPHDKDSSNYSKDQEGQSELFFKIMKIPEEEKEYLHKRIRENMVKVSA